MNRTGRPDSSNSEYVKWVSSSDACQARLLSEETHDELFFHSNARAGINPQEARNATRLRQYDLEVGPNRIFPPPHQARASNHSVAFDRCPSLGSG